MRPEVRILHGEAFSRGAAGRTRVCSDKTVDDAIPSEHCTGWRKWRAVRRPAPRRHHTVPKRLARQPWSSGDPVSSGPHARRSSRDFRSRRTHWRGKWIPRALIRNTTITRLPRSIATAFPSATRGRCVHERDRRFETVSLEQGVCKLSVLSLSWSSTLRCHASRGLAAKALAKTDRLGLPPGSQNAGGQNGLTRARPAPENGRSAVDWQYRCYRAPESAADHLVPRKRAHPPDDGRIGGLDPVDGGGAGCLGAGLAPPERLKDKCRVGLLRAGLHSTRALALCGQKPTVTFFADRTRITRDLALGTRVGNRLGKELGSPAAT
jgi:hypothetical protein